MDGKDIEEVEKLVCRGTTISTVGGAEEDIKARLGKA